jgi:hypothetical protein
MAKLAIATGHATCMQVFNDLQYSNKCKCVSISWPVAMVTLPLNTAEYHKLYRNTKSFFISVIVLMAPSTEQSAI